jgi:hypothetical protein
MTAAAAATTALTTSAIAVATRKPRKRTTPPAAPPPPALEIRTVLVSPDLARRWLARNAEDQRHQRQHKIEAFARDMKAGKWQITGDTVKLTGSLEEVLKGTGEDFWLIDGQHRLEAIVLADVSVYLVVALNVPHGAMAVIDTGTARTFADGLRGLPISNRNETATIVRRIYKWDRGNPTGKGGGTPTHSELLEHFNADPDGFVAAVGRGVDVARAKVVSAGIGGTAYYLFNRVDAEYAHRFFDGLVTGANLPSSHPILAVRDRLMRGTRRREERVTPIEQLVLLIRAWNAFRQDRTMDRLVITKADLTTRDFPRPK